MSNLNSGLIHNTGSPSAPVWICVDKPYDADSIQGHVFSCPMGWVFRKMLKDAGIDNYYIISANPEIGNNNAAINIVAEVNHYKPPIVIPLDVCAANFSYDLVPKFQKKGYDPSVDSEIEKYAGSIMTSDRLDYSHYMIPTFHPDRIVKQWKERDIVTSIDLGKAREELIYWIQYGKLKPLEERVSDINFDSDYDFQRLLSLLESWRALSFISNDIETIYPRPPTKNIPSQFYKIHPGLPITIGLAPNPNYGISFALFRDSKSQTVELWRALARLLKEVPSIGQNFFNFDANFFEMLGFEIDLPRCRDTMIRHATLWPELPHKLQFLARQYTRMKYWKDEGAGWTMKDMRKMKLYNCLDVMGTYEIYNQQELEFDARPQLK